MSEDEIKRILKDIEKQGFPLEVKTSEVLEARGWEVTNQVAYLDYEKEKYRTVDIVAIKNILLKPSELGFDVHLVIECKKSSKPWVFYASDFDLNDPEIRRKAVASNQFFIWPLEHKRKTLEKFFSLITGQFLLQNHLISPIFGKLAYIPFEPFTQGQRGSIHKARMQVCNAILDLENRQYQEMNFTFPYGVIFIPVIVLDGHLYTYKNGELHVEEGLYYHVTYVDSAFMIEIVTQDFLDTYLDIFESQIKKFQTEHSLQDKK